MDKKPCPLCKDYGMVPAPGDWRENGGWETCPMCYPDADRDTVIPPWVGWLLVILIILVLVLL